MKKPPGVLPPDGPESPSKEEFIVNHTSQIIASEVVDLTAPAARAQRDTLAARTDVLDKVKVLSLLPDDMHATTEQVATYFEVSVDTISQLVARNRDELSSDGYAVVKRSDLATDILSAASKIGRASCRERV